MSIVERSESKRSTSIDLGKIKIVIPDAVAKDLQNELNNIFGIDVDKLPSTLIINVQDNDKYIPMTGDNYTPVESELRSI